MKFFVPLFVTLAILAGYKVYKFTQQPLSAEERIAAFETISKDSDVLMQQFEAALASGDTAEVSRLNTALETNFAKIDALMDRPDPGPPPPPSYQALFDAIENDGPDDIRALLTPDLDLNVAVGPYNSVPLHRAMMRPERSAEVIDMFLNAGARADFATDQGYSALHLVADTSYLDDDLAELAAIVALLLTHGADIEARTHWDWTPLHRAVMEGLPMELEALLINGADPNVRFGAESLPEFSRGMTPLMVAGSEHQKVALLLRYGADPRLVGAAGETSFGFFKRKAAKAGVELAIKDTAGNADDFDHEYAAGLSQSLALIEAHLSDG